MADLFISYAREDQPFVERLFEALSGYQSEVWVDFEGLFVGEEFWERICSEIDSALAFVFVVSKQSAQSDYCRRESEHAASNKKRILPIVIDDARPESLPEPIRKRHWMSFKKPERFEESIESLIQAINQDPDWVHAHTRLLVRAKEWESRNRSPSLGLRGEELEEAIAWLTKAIDKEPAPHDLQLEFIQASQREERRRREEAELRARISLSRALTSQAELIRTTQGGSLLVATLVAAEAVRQYQSPEAQTVLRRTLPLLPPYVAGLRHQFRVGTLCFSPDGRRLATASGMTMREEQGKEWARSAKGPSLEDVDEYTIGMQRLRDEDGSSDAEVFSAILWDTTNGSDLFHLKHSGRVRSLEFSPDGERLVTGGEDGKVTIWSVTDGNQVAQLSHSGPVSFTRLSPDGSRLISVASEDEHGVGELATRVWLAEGREQVVKIPLGGLDTESDVLRQEMTSFAINPDCELLAAGFIDGSVRFWSLDTGQVLDRLEVANDVYCLAFSPNGRTIAIGEERTVRVFLVKDLQEHVSLPHDYFVKMIKWSPLGDRIATASAEFAGIGCTAVDVWDLSGTRIASFDPGHVTNINFQPDGQAIAIALSGGLVQIFEIGGSDNEIARLHFDDGVDAVCFSLDGSQVAAAGDDYTARIWTTRFGSDVLRLTLEDRVKALRLTADGRFVAYADSTNCRVIDVQTGEEVASLNADCSNIVFSQDGTLLALEADPHVIIWHWGKGEKIRIKHGNVYTMAFSADAEHLVTAGSGPNIYSGLARAWDVSNGRMTAEVDHDDSVTALAISPDSASFASGSGLYQGHGGKIADIRNGRLLAATEYAEAVNDIDFSPDGQYLAVVYSRFGLYILSAKNGHTIADLHGPRVKNVLFSPDGGQLATVEEVYEEGHPYGTVKIFDMTNFQFHEESPPTLATLSDLESPPIVNYLQGGAYFATEDRAAIRIWDTKNWQELVRFESVFDSASFSLEGDLLANVTTTNNKSQLRVYHWSPESLLESARRRVTRNLTHKEWNKYVGDIPYEAFKPEHP
jgi:WD40 repeat protein